MTLVPTLCIVEDCKNKAAWFPVVRFSIPNEQKRSFVLKEPTCDRCSTKRKLSEVLPQATWDSIAEMFTGNGFSRPKQEETELLWHPMNQVTFT